MLIIFNAVYLKKNMKRGNKRKRTIYVYAQYADSAYI